MLITAAICTWNRAELLRLTLAEMVAMDPLPPGVSWELLVVDNASTDATQEVLAEYRTALPIRVIRQAQPGLSHSRNAAIEVMLGEYIVWTDDDVLVDRAWLRSYAAAFEMHPNAAIFGGPIEPWFEGEPPRWLRRVLSRVASAYALRPVDGIGEMISASSLPFGANMAFRSDVLTPQAFDTRLGRVGASTIGGEETSLIAALVARGMIGLWVPKAKVRHFIPCSRQTVEYLRRYYVGLGATGAVMEGGSKDISMWFGRPRWAWRAAVENELRYLWRRLTGQPEKWIDALKDGSMARGALRLPASHSRGS